MLIEATRTTITYKLRDGQIVVLQPGLPMELSDKAGRQLLRKAGALVRRITARREAFFVLRALEPLTIEIKGQVITFDQWAIFTVPADRAPGLLAQFPNQLEVLDLPPDPPAEPVQPGWLVVYRDRAGRLAGGADDRAHGTVQACAWNGSTWLVTLANGQRLPLSAVRSVAVTDPRGQVIASWTVREHGYDGQKA